VVPNIFFFEFGVSPPHLQRTLVKKTICNMRINGISKRLWMVETDWCCLFRYDWINNTWLRFLVLMIASISLILSRDYTIHNHTQAHTRTSQYTHVCKLCVWSRGSTVAHFICVQEVVGSKPGVADIGLAFLLIINHLGIDDACVNDGTLLSTCLHRTLCK